MKKIGISLVLAGVMALGLVVPVMADNVCDNGGKYVTPEMQEAAGCKTAADKTVMPAAVQLINLAVSIVALIAVGIIIYGGVSYVISTGDAAKLNRAKNSIIYGVVGLVVALLAYAIVFFVSQSIFK